MPEISRFFGIVIKMLYEAGGKHNKPHVHVEYGEYEASVGIDGEVLAGVLPEKQYKLVAAWLTLHLKDKKERIARFGKEVFDIKKENDLQTAEETIRVLKSWYVKIGAPVSMKEAGIYAPNIQELVSLAIKGAKLRKVPGLTERLVEKLYRSCI